MTIDPEFKKALQNLPSVEKDKLILRLLKHNLNLANRLRFELVDTETMEEKRASLQNEIEKSIRFATERYYSPGYLLMDLRGMSGMINEHVAITKDKYGEICLTCFMLKNLLQLNNERIATENFGKAYTFCIYIIAKMFKIFLLIQKQHEDLHLEFREDIEAIGHLVGNNHHLMKVAINNGLDVNWLIHFEIPYNIADIHKELRSRGYLK
ncbi:MAG: hypothetical protein RL060_619 [Bacteroidota bacterium]